MGQVNKESEKETKVSTEKPDETDLHHKPLDGEMQSTSKQSDSEKPEVQAVSPPSSGVSNDDDLEEMVNEIDSLQEDMKEAFSGDEMSTEDPFSDEALSRISRPTSGVAPDSHSQQGREFDHLDDEAWLGRATMDQVSQSNQLHSHSEEQTEGALVMTVLGNLAFRFKHDRTGQEVRVSFVNDSLRIVLEDGTELTFPLMRKSTVGQVA